MIGVGVAASAELLVEVAVVVVVVGGTVRELEFSMLFDRFREKKLDCRKSRFQLDSSPFR